ncbi:MAG: ABC transporter, partial [Clostridia bacterium]|nr:ABC transporter [Clostridia bacterium]
SSHILSEVQEVCSRIMIISKGRLVANDTPENLEKRMRGDFRLELVIKGQKSDVEPIVAALPDLGDFTLEAQGGTTAVSLTTKDNKDIAEEVFFAFAKARMPILEMRPIRSSLEDIFLELTGNKEEVAFRRESHRVGTGKEEA